MKKMLLCLCLSIPVFGIETAAYTNLLIKAENTPVVIFEKEDFSWDKHPGEIKQQFKEGFEARIQLQSLSPSEAWEKLTELVEDGWGIDVETRIYCDGNGYATGTVAEAVLKQMRIHGGLQFGYEAPKCMAFSWFHCKEDDRIFCADDLYYFWYVYGRKHMPKIWQAWYACWQEENRRENPREFILSFLISDITSMGYHIFPYIFKELLNGDKSLEAVIKPFQKGYRYPQIGKDYAKWWETNREKYTLQDAEGWARIERALANGKMRLEPWVMEQMPNWHREMESYFEHPDHNYWYYRLPEKEEYEFEDVRKAISESLKEKEE